MKIAVGSDHRGFEAKRQIKAVITQLGHEVIDVGTTSSDPVDYPDPAYLAAIAVSKNQADRAILACGTGIGMSITANKIKGIRAALFSSANVCLYVFIVCDLYYQKRALSPFVSFTIPRVDASRRFQRPCHLCRRDLQ